MNNVVQEITREYRLDFNNGETHWDDPIPPEVTSRLLGRRVTCVISRTSLLAWSLMMDVREVEVADVTADGWMKIEVSTGPDFDHTGFTRDIAAKVTEVTQGGPRARLGGCVAPAGELRGGPTSLTAARDL
jgi:hypothetical protein